MADSKSMVHAPTVSRNMRHLRPTHHRWQAAEFTDRCQQCAMDNMYMLHTSGCKEDLMGNVLIVDDVEQRHVRIKSFYLFPGSSTDHATSFRSRMKPDDVTDNDLAWADAAWLDHDMCRQSGSGMFCEAPDKDGWCTCPTGRDVAKRLAAQGRRPLVYIHSANPVGAKAIQVILADAGFRVRMYPASRWT